MNLNPEVRPHALFMEFVKMFLTSSLHTHMEKAEILLEAAQIPDYFLSDAVGVTDAEDPSHTSYSYLPVKAAEFVNHLLFGSNAPDFYKNFKGIT